MKARSLFLTFWLMLAGFCLAGMPVQAQEEIDEELTEASEDKPAKKKKSKKKKGSKKRKTADAEEESAASEPAVLAALKKFKVHNGKVNTKADYYIYLYSASWCRYCKECMPVAVEQYKKMKAGRKVEIIVIGGDKTEKEAIKYLKDSKAKMPGIMFDELKTTNFQGLPSCGMPGFPAVTVVTKEGQMKANVVGGQQVKDVLTNWKKYTVGK